MAIIPGQTGKNFVIDTPQKQKNRKLLALLVVVVLATVAVLYFGFSSPSEPLPATTGLSSEQIDQSNQIFEALAKITLENQIFMNKKFQSLIMNEKLPVVAGEKGRQNPFAPF